jgi:hypothetical protein
LTAGIWTRLGIEPTRDMTEIRRAYARGLKRAHPEDDPEGFAALRAAYEAALGWAQSGLRSGIALPVAAAAPAKAAPAAGDAALAPAAPPLRERPAEPASLAKEQGVAPPHGPPQPPQPPQEDPDLALLRREFQRLQESLAGGPASSPESLQALLDACLRSRALETISVSLAFEDALAGVLWVQRTRADALIERAVTRFGWRETRRRQGPCLALAAYADHLRPLREARDKAPRAYLALTRPVRATVLWWWILRYRVDLAVHPIWRSLSVIGNAPPAAVSRDALGWWSRYFTRPRPRPLLLRLTGLLALLGAVVGLGGGSDGGRAGQGALLGGLAGALGGLLLTGSYLAAVDWPRHWLKDRRRATTPLGRLGWMPAALGLCLLAGIAPDTVIVRTVIGLLASAAFLWAAVVTPEAGLGGSGQVLQRLWGKLLANVPLGAWWVILSGAKAGAPSLVMWWSLIAAMGAFAFGLPALFVEYRRALTAAMRRALRLGIAVVSAAAAVALASRSVEPGWRGVALMGMAVIVLLQRVPALALPPSQLRLRYYLTVPTSVVLLGPIVQSGFLGPFRLSGVLFMAAVAISMLACEYQEWRHARRETRGAPVLRARL